MPEEFIVVPTDEKNVALVAELMRKSIQPLGLAFKRTDVVRATGMPAEYWEALFRNQAMQLD